MLLLLAEAAEKDEMQKLEERARQLAEESLKDKPKSDKGILFVRYSPTYCSCVHNFVLYFCRKEKCFRQIFNEMCNRLPNTACVRHPF